MKIVFPLGLPYLYCNQTYKDMGNILNLSGKKFGKLSVIEFYGTKNKCSVWTCRCDCGTVKQVRGNLLTFGSVKSCGCTSVNRTHGMTKTKEYKAWRTIISRCHNITDKGYFRYGERGIRVCDRWRSSFVDFFMDMGKSPSPTHSIDRIDNNGNYEPSNCRWATAKEQANNRRNNCFISFNDSIKTITGWADHYNIDVNTLRWRLSRGWSLKDAFNRPVSNTGNHYIRVTK